MKLNAEQIKKALECCNRGTTEDCAKCPRFDGDRTLSTEDCMEKLMRDALALIKELTEEKEKPMLTSSLQGAIIGSLRVAANELTTDKERLEKLLDDKCDRCIERERADTVRKMQERLKIAMRDVAKYSFGGREYSVIGEEFIDQIAKEMLDTGNDNTLEKGLTK